jgi:Protein of unknown function (DUF2939)
MPPFLSHVPARRLSVIQAEDRMRKIIFACLALTIVIVGYWAWALMGAVQLAAVASRGDVTAIMQRVDLPALRRSLGSQIVHAYLKQNPKYEKLGVLGRGLAGSLGGSVADAMLQQALTPENVSLLLNKGRVSVLKAATGSESETLWQMPPLNEAFHAGVFKAFFQSSFDGPVNFVILLDNAGESYGVHLALSGTTWRLSGLDIPEDVCDRLARSIVEKQNA